MKAPIEIVTIMGSTVAFLVFTGYLLMYLLSVIIEFGKLSPMPIW